MKRVIAFICVLITLFTFLGLKDFVYAQIGDSSGVAVYVPVKDEKAEEGDVISLSKDGYILGKEAYDPNIFGVVVKNPAVAFESDLPGSKPVVAQGKVIMKVSTANGAIKNGDLLTTSKYPGVGQKATQMGFVVATALESYNAASPEKVGKILVVLNVGLRNASAETGSLSSKFSNLTHIIEMIREPELIPPQLMLRLVFAGLMVLISFMVGVGYFGKISGMGIEALGRNPLARATIIFGIAINMFLAFGIISIGMAVGYFILVI